MKQRILADFRANMERGLNRLWYTRDLIMFHWLLKPIAFVYQGIARVRREILERFFQQQTDIPIIVVGNLTVGGVGKTPLVIALANQLQAEGWRVGIVSRGYGATIRTFPHLVSLLDSAAAVGDEPLLMAKRTRCPVVIAPKRMQAVSALLKQPLPPQIIISDDGLQHYTMGRSLEIAVVDGKRHLGNLCCLPAGPLREPPARLNEVDLIVVNGITEPSSSFNHLMYQMEIQPCDLRRLDNDELISWSSITKPIAAVVGIGHPERFFSTLQALDISFASHIFPDHHAYHWCDFEKIAKTVVMTEKDAVKCAAFATDTMYYLPVEAKLGEDFWKAFLLKLDGLKNKPLHEIATRKNSYKNLNI